MPRTTRPRTRRRRNALPPYTLPLIALGILALIGLTTAAWKHPAVVKATTVSIRKSFGGPDYSEPVSKKVMLEICVNSSGSAARKEDKEIDMSRTVEMAQLVGDDAKMPVRTYIRRFADVPELLHTATNDPATVKRVLQKLFVDVPPPHTTGTDLARVLEEVQKDMQAEEKEAPNALTVLSIATDGAAEDVPGKDVIHACHLIAEQLAGKRILVFVHGILPKDRLREQAAWSLEPLVKAGKVFMCNATDYAYAQHQFEERLHQELKSTP